MTVRSCGTLAASAWIQVLIQLSIPTEEHSTRTIRGMQSSQMAGWAIGVAVVKVGRIRADMTGEAWDPPQFSTSLSEAMRYEKNGFVSLE